MLRFSVIISDEVTFKVFYSLMSLSTHRALFKKHLAPAHYCLDRGSRSSIIDVLAQIQVFKYVSAHKKNTF